MKKTFTNLINLVKANKKNSILVVCSVALVTVVAIVAAFSMGERGKVDVEPEPPVITTESTTAEVVEDAIVTESTTESITEAEVDEPAVSTVVSTTSKPKVEATTKKVSTTKAETTTKKVTTTKAETTTKKNTEGTFNGHKPYEVFVDASKGGNSYYYDENGNLWRAESLTAKPQEPTDECPLCGKENCGAYIKPWHCVVCDKDIAADECHPKSHLDKSL